MEHTLEPPRTILVVDDERVVLDLMRRVLVRAEYTVLEAESGHEALEVAAA